MLHYTFQWRQAFVHLPDMLQGALVSFETAVLSMVIGTVVALALALARRSDHKVLSGGALAYIELARNTPALFQIYMIYFGLGALGIRIDSYPALLLGISFNNSGYLAETLRGSLRAIPDTQARAARSLGFGAPGAFFHVVLPQLIRVAYYPITNQMVWALLTTSLGITVGLSTDLMGVTNYFNSQTFRTFEFFSISAVLYYVMAKLMMVSARTLGYRLFRY